MKIDNSSGFDFLCRVWAWLSILGFCFFIGVVIWFLSNAAPMLFTN